MPAQKNESPVDNEPRYHVLVFGKAGCDKCTVLEKRLDQILAREEWKEFTKLKFDLETEEGLIEFCTVECMNPQRVPGFVVARRDRESGRFEFLPASGPEDKTTAKDICGQSRLYSWLGLQTDYSEHGKGVISSRMITAILSEARSCQ